MDGDPNAAGRILALLPGACKIGLKKEKEKEKGKKKQREIGLLCFREGKQRKKESHVLQNYSIKSHLWTYNMHALLTPKKTKKKKEKKRGNANARRKNKQTAKIRVLVQGNAMRV